MSKIYEVKREYSGSVLIRARVNQASERAIVRIDTDNQHQVMDDLDLYPDEAEYMAKMILEAVAEAREFDSDNQRQLMPDKENEPGLTMEDLGQMQIISDDVATSKIAIDLLIAEVRRLGGPVCSDCRRNTARYDNGLCSLCDLKLPPCEQGKRI